MGGRGRRGGFLSRLLAGERPEIVAGLCIVAILAFTYYALFAGEGEGGYATINTLSGSLAAVSTFAPAKDITWMSVQKSCTP